MCLDIGNMTAQRERAYLDGNAGSLVRVTRHRQNAGNALRAVQVAC